jgi:hypothetical protein
MIDFSNWLISEKRDIFGFEREMVPERRNDNEDKPIKQFNTEELMNYLMKSDLGQKKSNYRFLNELHWGFGPGAIRITVGQKYQVIIEQRGVDLEGNNRWFAKRVFQLDQSGYGGHEPKAAQEILEIVQKINEQNLLPSPSHEYKELENLVISLTNSMRRVAREIFVFNGITKLDENNYIIRFGLRGHGLEYISQRRILENQTNVSFCPSTGVIRIFTNNLATKTGEAPRWEIQDQDTNWFFSPNQPRDEIVECLATRIRWY